MSFLLTRLTSSIGKSGTAKPKEDHQQHQHARHVSSARSSSSGSSSNPSSSSSSSSVGPLRRAPGVHRKHDVRDGSHKQLAGSGSGAGSGALHLHPPRPLHHDHSHVSAFTVTRAGLAAFDLLCRERALLLWIRAVLSGDTEINITSFNPNPREGRVSISDTIDDDNDQHRDGDDRDNEEEGGAPATGASSSHRRKTIADDDLLNLRDELVDGQVLLKLAEVLTSPSLSLSSSQERAIMTAKPSGADGRKAANPHVVAERVLRFTQAIASTGLLNQQVVKSNKKPPLSSSSVSTNLIPGWFEPLDLLSEKGNFVLVVDSLQRLARAAHGRYPDAIPALPVLRGGQNERGFSLQQVQQATLRLNRLPTSPEVVLGPDMRTMKRIPLNKGALNIATTGRRPRERRVLGSIIGQMERTGAPALQSKAAAHVETVVVVKEPEEPPQPAITESVSQPAQIHDSPSLWSSTTDMSSDYKVTSLTTTLPQLEEDNYATNDDDDDWDTDPDFQNSYVSFSRDIARRSGIWNSPIGSPVASPASTPLNRSRRGTALQESSVTSSDDDGPPLAAYHEISRRDLEIDYDGVLGEGAFATIYKAKLWGVPVAAKVLKLKETPVEMLTEFRLEVNVMMQLRHPNVLMLIGAICQPGKMLALVMDLCDRGSLFKLERTLARTYGSDGDDLGGGVSGEPQCLFSALPENEFRGLLKLLLDAARGLVYLHKLGIVHLDIKPQNVLVASPNIGRIADMGMSRIKREIATEDIPEYFGTPGFMSPEQYGGGLGITEKADVFAFGNVTLTILDLGHEPFSEYDQIESIEEAVVVRHERPRIPNVGSDYRWIKDMIRACWEHEPNDRPTMEEVAQAIELNLVGEGDAVV